MAAIRNELESILRVHAPHKLDHLDNLISRHAGREHVLLNKIRAKYGFPQSVDREHARGPCQQSMQQSSCALSHGLRKHTFSIARGGGALLGGQHLDVLELAERLCVRVRGWAGGRAGGRDQRSRITL